MTLPQADVPVLMLAAGSGITPMMAMLRTLGTQARRAPVTLLYWARTREESCFADELRAMAARHANFSVRFALTREVASASDEVEGRITSVHVAPWVSVETQVFACGPGDFVEQARVLVASQAARFVSEAFTPSTAVESDSGTVAVTLAKTGRTLQVARGQSLLTALEAEGLRPAYGCRMGVCNTCACGKASGTTRYLPSGVLEREPVSALRICVNAATTDLVLDL